MALPGLAVVLFRLWFLCLLLLTAWSSNGPLVAISFRLLVSPRPLRKSKPCKMPRMDLERALSDFDLGRQRWFHTARILLDGQSSLLCFLSSLCFAISIRAAKTTYIYLDRRSPSEFLGAARLMVKWAYSRHQFLPILQTCFLVWRAMKNRLRLKACPFKFSAHIKGRGSSMHHEASSSWTNTLTKLPRR